jgi:hypothetical protein
MDHQGTYEKRQVDEIEKPGAHGENVLLDKKMTRTVLWKLDTR